MPNFLSHFLSLFKLAAVKAEDEESSSYNKSFGTWARHLSFSSSSQSCVEEEEEEECIPPPPPADCIASEDAANEKKHSPSFIKSKLVCTLKAGKYGFVHGSLTGIFFGGGWGMYQYMDANWLQDTSGKDGKGDESKKENDKNASESTVNENIVFVSAADGAIIVGIVCALLSSTKAAIFCH